MCTRAAESSPPPPLTMLTPLPLPPSAREKPNSAVPFVVDASALTATEDDAPSPSTGSAARRGLRHEALALAAIAPPPTPTMSAAPPLLVL